MVATAMRQRRQQQRAVPSHVQNDGKVNCKVEDLSPVESSCRRAQQSGGSQNALLSSAAVAVAALVYVGVRFSRYLKQLHETEMFFSAIQVAVTPARHAEPSVQVLRCMGVAR